MPDWAAPDSSKLASAHPRSKSTLVTHQSHFSSPSSPAACSFGKLPDPVACGFGSNSGLKSPVSVLILLFSRFFPMPLSLAHRLGTSAHLSPLVQKAKRLGARKPEDLEHIALARGLRYFGKIDPTTGELPPETPMLALDPKHFSNEELAITLMSPSLPYSLTRLRMAGAMLGALGISAHQILRLARLERCETIVRHIAECASQVEPHHPLWGLLLEHLPHSPPPAPDILPHPTRFVAMSGLDRTGRSNRMQWIRPTP